MTLKYLLFEKDYLENQLYYASKSPFVINQKKNMMNGIIFTMVMLSICLFVIGSNYWFLLSVIFLIVIFLIVYPSIVSSRFKKSYQMVIVELFKNRFGQTSIVEFREDSLIDANNMRTIEIFHSSLESVEETGRYFFIWLNYGEQLIIPKSEVDQDAVQQYLETLARQLGIPYNSNLNWKWK